MPYYCQSTPNAQALFSSGVNRHTIVANLQANGASDVTALGLTNVNNRAVFDSKFCLLMGTTEDTRDDLKQDLYAYLGNDIDEFGLRVPQYKEWMGCVTLVDNPDNPNFQVVACVAASLLKSNNIQWTVEDQPPQVWKTHVSYDQPTDVKMVRDVLAFTGRGRW